MTDTNRMGPAKSRLVVTTALGATLFLVTALALSACGKLGTLEQAQPVYGRDAKSSWSASQAAPKAAATPDAPAPAAAASPTAAAAPDAQVAVAQNAGGGNTATLDAPSATRETERAKPDANGKNKTPDPYKGAKKISDAPLEGFGNAEGH